MDSNKPKQRTTAEIMEAVKKRAEEAKARNSVASTVATIPENVSLPVWADSVRGVPNSILRSALFGVSQKRKVYSKRTLIAAVDGYEIRFMGFGFNQTDFDTFAGALHTAMPHPLGVKVEFSTHSFLKSLGRGVGGKDHEELKDQIARLMGGVVEISDLKAKKTYMGTLIQRAYRDDETGNYVVIFNPELVNLYEKGCYTLCDWDKRMALGSNNLAKWLLDIYSTHAKPLPYKVETLRELCGSDTKELREFRRLLKRALDALKTIGAIESWEIDENDLVHVVRTPSNSQRRHLAKQQPTRTSKPSSNTVLGHLTKLKR